MKLKLKQVQKDEAFTFMIMPHSGRTAFSISIPYFIIKIIGGILVGTMILVGVFAIHFSISYKRTRVSLKDLYAKTKDYYRLQKELDYFMEKTKDLEEKMQELEELDKNLRDLLENDPVLKKNHEQSLSRSLEKTPLASRGNIDRERALIELKRMEEELPQREQSLKELKEAVEKRNEEVACTPTIAPVNGKITSKFGYRTSPYGSRREFHNGLDIAANYGTPIKATADGVVVFTGYISGYGRVVTLQHENGYETSYAHCSKVVVKTGMQVKKGEHIANVGNTGRSTGPHVHYMVKYQGQLKNPQEYIN